MTALSANTFRKSRILASDGKQAYPAAASVTIYAGAIVMLDSAGYARPAAASVNNNGVVGVATHKCDNSAGSAGDNWIEAQEGTFLFAGQTLAQASVGDKVYCDDDNTVDETQTTNTPIAGKLVEFESASLAWVRVTLDASGL